MPLPHVTVILAMSADGKIADAQRSAARFSSDHDLAHLEAEIAEADAVLMGAETLRAYGTTLPVRHPDLIDQRRRREQASQPVQIICSASGSLPRDLAFFRQPVPRGLLTTPAGASLWRQEFDYIWPLNAWHWPDILQSLGKYGIERLALLGGGELVAALVAADCVDELVLTVCPLLLGGKMAPTPMDGEGFWADQAPRLVLCSVDTFDQEVRLRYRLQRSGNSITLGNNQP
ncbi:riboflavin deaminase [filamentous cyanobacterium CCP5]|nr:riboflavin deaminase [filamentous cyanobacterium CCP5]